MIYQRTLMSNKEQYKRQSKFLSLILRHKPEEINLSLDGNGWVNVDLLIKGMNSQKDVMSKEILDSILESDSKGRYEYNDDETKVRARQGHSIKVDLGFKKVKAPDKLFHGTVEKAYKLIINEGLKSMARHHVHLSEDLDTAVSVGSRRGDAIVLVIDSKSMQEDGYDFFISNNGVWLCEDVPIKYISLLDE